MFDVVFFRTVLQGFWVNCNRYGKLQFKLGKCVRKTELISKIDQDVERKQSRWDTG